MWTVLFYVTPASVGAALLLLLISAFIFALLARNTGAGFTGTSQIVLATASMVYIAALAILPISGIEEIGESERKVHWNPFDFLGEFQENQQSEESYATQLSNGDIVLYSTEELSAEEREEHLSWDSYDFFLHGNPEEPSVVSPDGSKVSPQDEAFVVRDMENRIPLEPLESSALLVEEKIVNTLLFIPVGIVAFHSFSSWLPRVAFGSALSVCIETVQLITASGRSADMSDVLFNSSGALIGTGLAVASVLCINYFLPQNPKRFNR